MHCKGNTNLRNAQIPAHTAVAERPFPSASHLSSREISRHTPTPLSSICTQSTRPAPQCRALRTPRTQRARPKASKRLDVLPATPRAQPSQPPSDPSRASEQARSTGRAKGQRDFLYYFSSSPLSLSALTDASQRAFLYHFARRPLVRSAALLRSRAPSPWARGAGFLRSQLGRSTRSSPGSLHPPEPRRLCRARCAQPPSAKLRLLGATRRSPRSLRAKRLAAEASDEFGAYHYFIYLCRANRAGVVVQLVRIPACHAGGRGFESRPYRQA